MTEGTGEIIFTQRQNPYTEMKIGGKCKHGKGFGDTCDDCGKERERLDAMPCSAKAFRICEHCNKEFQFHLIKDVLNGGYGNNFQDCPHCKKRNDIWIRLELPEPNAHVMTAADNKTPTKESTL